VPWEQEQPGSLFQPARDYEPPPYLPPDEDVTAVQPLPQPPAAAGSEQRQEPTKELPDATRKRFGRKKK
jgi:hypothetical protein